MQECQIGGKGNRAFRIKISLAREWPVSKEKNVPNIYNNILQKKQRAGKNYSGLRGRKGANLPQLSERLGRRKRVTENRKRGQIASGRRSSGIYFYQMERRELWALREKWSDFVGLVSQGNDIKKGGLGLRSAVCE